MGGAREEVFGGVWGSIAGGAEVALGSADPVQVAGEGRAVATAELVESSAEAAG